MIGNQAESSDKEETMELIPPPKRTVLRQEMKICNTSFLLKSTLLFYNESICGNRVRTFTHEKFGWIFGHTGYPCSLLSELSANLPVHGNCAECSTEFTPMIGFLRSRFDQGQAMVAHPAPGVEDAQQETEIYLASFAWKILCTIQMSQSVEMVSNIHHKTFALNVRRNSPQPSIFVRWFNAITSTVKFGHTHLEL